MKKKIVILLLLISLVQLISAADPTYVVSNSERWQDVYSSMEYSNLIGVGNDFLTSTSYGPILLNTINKQNDLLVISSKKEPFVFNYPSLINNAGFKSSEEILVDDANVDLFKRLNNIQNFVIVSDAYGYDAMAVIPYARATNSWVFLANTANIFEIDSILSQQNVNQIVIYGYLDKSIRDVLQKYNPEIIDTGDKFENNIEIVKKYLEVKPTKQVLLTNGEFIEKELMEGVQPILFTGRENVPDQIANYLKDSKIEIGVLIGNDLINAATNIRRTTGISVIAKFARGSRTQQQGVAAVEGLDLFPLPTPIVNLQLNSAKFNKINSQLEITYKSDSNIPIFLKGTITAIADGETTKIGDTDTIFMAPKSYKTIIYPLDVNSPEKLEIELYTLFGESKTSLDRVLKANIEAEMTEVIDNCKMEITKLAYNKQSNIFKVEMKNIAEVDCWATAEIENVKIDNRLQTIGSENSVKIDKGKKGTIKIKADLTDEDLANNEILSVTAYYGEKEDSLVNIIKGDFKLKIESLSLVTYAIIGLIVTMIILIIIIIVIKRREKEEDY